MILTDGLTMVIPTYNEHDNVRDLVQTLKFELRNLGMPIRLLFVDDSPNDLTIDAVESAAHHYAGPNFEVHHIHRPVEDRNGLSGAVVLGIEMTTTNLVGVMDGDGQHPPRTIPSMVGKLQSNTCDLVVASRYCTGGSADGLGGPVRHVVSRLSTWVAKGLFPRATQRITDPMTGFFLVRTQAINVDLLANELGFKILLALMVRHPRLRKGQVPLQFEARTAGVSKGTMKQGLLYLQQLLKLRFTRSTTVVPEPVSVITN